MSRRLKTTGEATYAGNWRILYFHDHTRLAQQRMSWGWFTYIAPLPNCVRCAYTAGNWIETGKVDR